MVEPASLFASLSAASDVAATTVASHGASGTHWWEDFRLIQVTVTGSLAFLGFTFGTWVKYLFDLRLRKKERQRQQKTCAAALCAEVETLSMQAAALARSIRKRVETKTQTIRRREIRFMRVATPVIYPSLTTTLGLLHSDLANSVALFYTELARIESWSNEARAIDVSDDSELHPDIVTNLERQLLRLTNLGKCLSNALSAYANDEEWRAALRDAIAAQAPNLDDD